MTQKVIAIDCDEVLAETLDAVLAYHHYLVKGQPISKEDITNYHLHEIRNLFLTQPEDKDYNDGYVRKQQSIEEIQPVQGAKEKLTAWKKNGYKLYVVTGRGDNLKDITYKWIDKRYPSVFDDIVFANTHRKNQKSKAAICQDLGAKTMIEDFPYYAENVAAAGIQTYLLAKPWNQYFDAQKHENIIKVSGWEEVS